MLSLLYDICLIVICSADPSNVKHILATDFESFGKGAKFHAMLETFLGSGIFTTDGDLWKSHRAIARPFFSSEHVANLECFEKQVDNTIGIMMECATKQESFDVQASH